MTPDEIAALPYRPCVGVVLTDGQGRVFAGQRADMDTPAWQMPQGGDRRRGNPGRSRLS
jgi:putative (di)nucleoside polyphosphate hydrolase